ncbi:MAG: RNA-binding protein [Nitrospirae bacterium]|nr:RNA-binding protein [Nitrospirota bacterium]
MGTKLFVGNLSYEASEKDLTELFAQAGTVESVKIVTDKYSGQPRGFGFVEMSTSGEAQNAISMLNGTSVKDRNITVTEAKPRTERDTRDSRGGGRGHGGGGGGGGRKSFRR